MKNRKGQGYYDELHRERMRADAWKAACEALFEIASSRVIDVNPKTIDSIMDKMQAAKTLDKKYSTTPRT